IVPFLIVRVSGSKSQFGSGVPAAAFANNAENVVEAPTATFLQKPGPAAVGALKVAGSHSSKETTCAVPGVSSSPIQPANRKQQTAKPSFDSVFVMDLFPFVSTVARETAGSVTYAAVWISRAIFAATLADACEDVNPCCPHLSPKFSPFLNY